MLAFKKFSVLVLTGLVLAVSAFSATPQDAVIRKNLTERLPNLPAIDEISKTPMDGLFEVRVNGSEIFYSRQRV
jgi:thiol:disulfide interchange protein DsbC